MLGTLNHEKRASFQFERRDSEMKILQQHRRHKRRYYLHWKLSREGIKVIAQSRMIEVTPEYFDNLSNLNKRRIDKLIRLYGYNIQTLIK
ncbi:MAG: hypothetical protein ABIV51_12525 [Saprospiraceae bacterium]